MSLSPFHMRCIIVFCAWFFGSVPPALAQEDALRQFFRDNNRLILVNPFPRSLPMGFIGRPEGGELREIDRDCFAKHQDKLVPSEPYDFIAVETEKRRGVTNRLLKHLGGIDVGTSERVSIQVFEGKRSVMGESRFSRIIEDPDFPAGCYELVRDKRNYIVYEIVTGRLDFTFWRKAGGKWQINRLSFLGPALEQKASREGAATPPQEEQELSALWVTTKEGHIQMKEARVLAVHARRWKRGEFDKPMPSFFQFIRIWKLDWKFGQLRQ